MEKIRVITLFSGYDSQCLALNRLKKDFPQFDYELVAWCEIDKYVIRGHDALFPQWSERNVGDVSAVDWEQWKAEHPGEVDLLTYSSPCQDFSSAGLQRGGEEGSGTRSGLLWETERAVRELRPRHLVFENVGGLVSDKFIDLFNRWQARLNSYGYTNFQQLMNAKDYGVPQNRLRIFMVSILDCRRAYYFPKPFKLERRLKDVLEQNVEERYYLKEEQVAKLVSATETHKERGNGFAFKPHTPEDEYASTIAHTTGGMVSKTDNFIAEPQINILGQLSSSQNSRIISADGISPAVINGEKDGMPKIAEPCIASMKSRDRDNPTGVRTANNGNFAQRLEPSADQSTSNTIASVAKDNLLIIPQATKEGEKRLNVTKDGTLEMLRAKDGKRITTEVYTPSSAEYAPTILTDNNHCKIYESQNELLRYEGMEPTIIDATNDFSEDEKRTYTEYSPALRSSRSGLLTTQGIRIRRLTERELYRLMDVEEKDIDTLLSAPIPRTQHAKLAGNSIVVACLYHIFRNIFVNTEPEAGTQTKLF